VQAGLLEIKDYFWYGKGFSLAMLPGTAQRIKKYTKYMEKMDKDKPWMSYLLLGVLGIFVVLVELPCTGAPYLAILALIGQGAYASALPLLLVYNFIFVFPLFIIIGFAYFGKSSTILEKWRKKHRGTMRLVIGLFLVLLGVYMLLSIEGIFVIKF